MQLSLNQAYHQSYSTISKAVKYLHCSSNMDINDSLDLQRAQQKSITRMLCQHIPISPHHHLLAVDVTSISRPYSSKLTDKSYVHCNEPVKCKAPITVGHEYSCVSYLPALAEGWCLPLKMARVPTVKNSVLFGLRQSVEIQSELKKLPSTLPCVLVADAAYSCKAAIHSNHASSVILITRLRGNRKLLRPASSDKPHKTRKHWYDQENPFYLKDETSWGEPAETAQVDWVTRGGKLYQVDIQVWNDLRVASNKDYDLHNIALSVVRITVRKSNQSMLYKHPLWLIIEGDWQGVLTLEMIWNDYRLRFDLEHFFRFAKCHLLLNSLQTPDTMTEENWMQIAMLSQHQLFHARTAAEFQPNPWEKSKQSKQKITPRVVQRDMQRLLPMAKNISNETKPRGVGLGRKLGERVCKRATSPIVIKSKKHTSGNKLTFEETLNHPNIALSIEKVEPTNLAAICQPNKINNVADPPA